MGYNPYASVDLTSRLIIVYLVFLLLDFIAYYGILTVFNKKSSYYLRKYFTFIHFTLSFAILLSFLIFYLVKKIPCDDSIAMRNYYLFIAFFILSYLPKLIFSIFIFIDFLIRIKIFLLNKIRLKYFKKPGKFESKNILTRIGAVFCLLLFLFVLYGILINKQNLIIVKQEIYIRELPASFENYRIALFSDMHLGSLRSPHLVNKTIKEINSIHPDIIIFAGDMVNQVADEADPYIECFYKLDKSVPEFSIFGNHDYGDYAFCYSDKMKKSEKNKLLTDEQKMGFTVLLNESVILRKGRDSIALIGVENWGSHPYKKYGNLELALKKVRQIRPKILLSHDPDHWTKVVAPFYDIDLTLSGHTHGMQMGIKIGKFSWSPSQYRFKTWNGLFSYGWKQIYVTRGVGFLGFPGRFGMRPEITLIVLKRYKL